MRDKPGAKGAEARGAHTAGQAGHEEATAEKTEQQGDKLTWAKGRRTRRNKEEAGSGDGLTGVGSNTDKKKKKTTEHYECLSRWGAFRERSARLKK